MALNHSPSILTNGLVFYYDMANTKKSNLGDATTNLITNADFSNGLTDWGNYVLAPTIVTANDVPTTLGTSRNVLQYNSPAVIGGGGNFGGTARPAPSLTAGVTYTISFYARSLSGPMQLNFSHQNGSGDDSNLAFASTINGTWQRYSRTANLNIQKNTFYIWNQTVANGIFQLADVQLEVKSVPTTFTASSRSTTQSIRDLTGTNTITNNGLTYTSDGNFSFNGVNNYFTIPSLGSISNYTIDLWVKMNSLSGQQRLFSTPGGGTFTVRWTASDFDFHYNPFDGSPPSTVTSATGLTYNTSTYYNLVATNSASNGARFYVNGELRSTGERAIDLTGECYFGVDRSLTLWSNCVLPAAKIYSRELTALEVQQNFNAQRGRYGV